MHPADIYVDGNWCPDCGLPRGVCRCDEETFLDPLDDEDDFIPGPYDEDGEPDFTLDELEWQETYPELCEEDDT